MKSVFLGCVTALCGLIATTANASPVTYDFTVDGGSWISGGTQAFGLTGQPTLSGSVTLDDEFSGISSITNFSFTTGTHTWTLNEFVGPFAQSVFSSSGELVQFSLGIFQSGDVSMYFYSVNTTSIFDPNGYFFCNNCIHVKPGSAVGVPEPETLGLLGLGLAAIGIFYRMRR